VSSPYSERSSLCLLRLAILLAILWPAVGCSRGFFQVSGVVSSEHGVLGTWEATPDGCSRDPLDGLSAARTRTLATFIWEPKDRRDRHQKSLRHGLLEHGWLYATPRRLEISRLPPGWTNPFPQPVQTLTHPAPGPPLLASMSTQGISGVAWTNTSCTVLQLDTKEEKPGIARGRPALGGTLRMDCTAQGSHITADLHFSRCDF
jgi:hypothetical protein